MPRKLASEKRLKAVELDDEGRSAWFKYKFERFMKKIEVDKQAKSVSKAILTSGIETLGYSLQGWDAVLDTDLELIDEKVGGPFSSTYDIGDNRTTVTDNSTTQADPDAITAQTLTDNSGGTPSDTIAALVIDPAAYTSATMTDSSGGTPGLTIGAVSGSGADTAINDNFASTGDQINKLIVDIGAIRTELNAEDDNLNTINASLVDEINKLKTDLTSVRTALVGVIDYADALKATVNALQGKLRETNGCGIFDD